MTNIKQAIEEISEKRRRLNEMEKWLVQNDGKFGGDVSTSTTLTKDCIYVNAGRNPVESARAMKATFVKRDDSWNAEFPDFMLTFLDAEPKGEQILL